LAWAGAFLKPMELVQKNDSVLAGVMKDGPGQQRL
jgi:hypothetical protein